MEEIMRALALLATLGVQDVPPVQVVDKAQVLAHSRPVTSVAYVVSCEPPIYVMRSSEAFKKAASGDARQLAAAIAHELVHIREGVYEAPAYAEQLRVLKALKVGSDVQYRVRKSAELHRHDRPSR